MNAIEAYKGDIITLSEASYNPSIAPYSLYNTLYDLGQISSDSITFYDQPQRTLCDAQYYLEDIVGGFEDGHGNLNIFAFQAAGWLINFFNTKTDSYYDYRLCNSAGFFVNFITPGTVEGKMFCLKKDTHELTYKVFSNFRVTGNFLSLNLESGQTTFNSSTVGKTTGLKQSQQFDWYAAYLLVTDENREKEVENTAVYIERVKGKAKYFDLRPETKAIKDEYEIINLQYFDFSIKH